MSWPIYVNIAALTCCDSTEKVDSSCTLLPRILEVTLPNIDRKTSLRSALCVNDWSSEWVTCALPWLHYSLVCEWRHNRCFHS